jgi:hypothetical protein
LQELDMASQELEDAELEEELDLLPAYISKAE